MESAALERITVAVYGLTEYGEGTHALAQVLSRVPGVSRAYVSAATEMAYIEYDPAQTDRAQLLQAIEGRGLKAGEVNVRSIGSRPPSAAVRWGAPATVSAPPPAGAPAHLFHAAPGALSPFAARAVTAQPGVLMPVSPPRRLASRLPLLAGAVGLVVILGILFGFSAAQSGKPDNVFTLEAGLSGYRPVTIVIPAGGPATLRVRNADWVSLRGGNAPHQFAIKELGINEFIRPGQTVTINLPPLQPATYHYFCNVCCGGSSDPAMQGALIVH